MSNNWKKVKENLRKKADAMKPCTAIVALRRQYFGEDYLDAGWAWEPAQLLDFLQDPEIAILEADPEE
jgi:hypothetical protein